MVTRDDALARLAETRELLDDGNADGTIRYDTYSNLCNALDLLQEALEGAPTRSPDDEGGECWLPLPLDSERNRAMLAEAAAKLRPAFPPPRLSPAAPTSAEAFTWRRADGSVSVWLGTRHPARPAGSVGQGVHCDACGLMLHLSDEAGPDGTFPWLHPWEGR